MTTHDPRAWRVAIALGLESGLDWSRWASGEYTRRLACGSCDAPKTKSTWSCSETVVNPKTKRKRRCGGVSRYDSPIPVPTPWDADAYLADVARRGVEPGPLPSLSWTGPDGFGWRVDTPFVAFLWNQRIVTIFDGEDDAMEWEPIEVPPRTAIYPRDLVGRIFSGATAAAKAVGWP